MSNKEWQWETMRSKAVILGRFYYATTKRPAIFRYNVKVSSGQLFGCPL